MSVNINFRAAPAASKWLNLKNGDFIIAEASDKVQIPNGLYRVFRVPNPEGDSLICLVPLFSGNFEEGLFPLFIDFAVGYPVLKHLVGKLGIDAEVIE